MIYLLDTNTISDLIEGHGQVLFRLSQNITAEHAIGLCSPIYYEVMRGLLWQNLRRKQAIFANTIRPQLDWIVTEDGDWLQTIQFWVDTKKNGRQLSDIDLLLAALAHRLDAVIVSSDNDFDALPVKRENWRTP